MHYCFYHLLCIFVILSMICFSCQSENQNKHTPENETLATQTTNSSVNDTTSTQPPFTFPKMDTGELYIYASQEGIEQYTPDTLYSKINGGAEVYIDYGMELLYTGRYYEGSNPDEGVELFVYQFADPFGAYGIFKTSTPTCEELTLGQFGCKDSSNLKLVQEQYFIQSQPLGIKPINEDALIDILDTILRQLPKGNSIQKALAHFPKEQQTTVTFGYEKTNAFGVELLGDMMTARYNLNEHPDQEYILFYTVHPLSVEQRLKDIQTYADTNEIEFLQSQDPRAHLVLDLFGEPLVLIPSSDRILGVKGLQDSKKALRILEPLVQSF